MPLYTADPATVIPVLHILTRHESEAEALASYEAHRGEQGWIGGSVRPPSAGSERWNSHAYYLNTSGHATGHRVSDSAVYITIQLSYAASVGIDLHEAHAAILSSCRHADRSAELSDGRRVCCECWNLSVYIRRAGLKAERAARMRCEVCQHHAAAYDLGAPRQISVCGRCKNKIEAAHRQRLAGVPSYLAMFATVHYTREQFIALARGGDAAAAVDPASGERLEQERMF